jgi:C-terminal processing protease CtpA/Prc
VVLDIRHHEGGQLEYPTRWTQAFMGTEFSHDDRYATLETRTSFRLYKIFAESYNAGNPARLAEAKRYFDEKISSLDAHESPESAWVIRGSADTQPGLLPSPTTLFVLMDSRTGSAGEGFVYLLRQFENVVFVGENTKGLMVSASPAWGTLPHSRLPFVLTVDISLKDAREGLEGIGYKPDIWVDPGRALDRVVRYIDSRSQGE